MSETPTGSRRSPKTLVGRGCSRAAGHPEEPSRHGRQRGYGGQCLRQPCSCDDWWKLGFHRQSEMKLPNANLAIIEEAKVIDYLLNQKHRFGARPLYSLQRLHRIPATLYQQQPGAAEAMVTAASLVSAVGRRVPAGAHHGTAARGVPGLIPIKSPR